jgi:hypothetical protein
LKGDDVLCVNRIEKKEEDYYSQKQHNIYCSRLNEQVKGGSTMKKLNLFVIITAFFTFGLVGMASAQDDGNWGAIKGTYEMIATGSCLHSPTGFDGTGTVANPFIPKGPTVYAAPTLARSTWIFDGGGTATFVGENFATIFPGGVNQGALERENPVGTQTNPLHFDYTVDGHGWIIGTIREVPAIIEGNLANLTLEGRISKDHKIITLSNGGQIQYPGTALTAICNSARILFKVND